MNKPILALMAGTVVILLLIWFSESRLGAAKFRVGLSLSPGKVAPQLVSTIDSAILLAPDGSLWAWGGTQCGLPGLFASQTITTIPKRVGLDSDWQGVTARDTHTLALKIDGSLWGWGDNRSGQLAQPNLKAHFIKPTRIGTETNWVQISTGASHCLGLKSDGSIWGWGENAHGQVGDGTSLNVLTVVRIGSDNDWRTIAAGAYNSYALKSNSTLWCWGFDNITRGSNTPLSPRQFAPGTNWISISVADYAVVALKSDGTLWIYGQNAPRCAPEYVKPGTAAFVQVGPDNDWQAAYLGPGFLFARKRDGSWWVCGLNSPGLAQGSVPSLAVASLRRLEFGFGPWAFATGYGNCALLTKDGTLWTWGERLGTSRSGAWEQVKDRINRFVAILSESAPQFPTWRPQIDPSPRVLWELPAAMRRSLGVKAKFDNQSATTPNRENGAAR